MTQYFPLPTLYQHTLDCEMGSDVYSAIRCILKDKLTKDRKYSVAHYTRRSSQIQRWQISDCAGKPILNVMLPYEDSNHPAALLVFMGTHTVEDTWHEHKNTWYEDLERQIAHLPKGDDP